MFRKSFISFTLAAFVVVGCSVAAFAQYMQVAGTVELVKADGTREPVADALIEVYRTDIKAGFPSAKTNKKGEFALTGMALVGQWIFAVSAPGCEPTVFPVPRGGGDRLKIELNPGDGRKLTEEEARKWNVLAATKPSGAVAGDQNKAQAELEAKRKEIEAKNEKVLKTNEIITKAFKEGNEAIAAKNYDLAIARYDEGIAADPDFVGSAPVLNNNRSSALRSRGVDTYNLAVKATDVSEKVANLGKARQDLAESAQGYLRSLNILNNAPASEIQDRANFDATKRAALSGAIETFRMAVRTEQVDPSVIEAAKLIIPEFISSESDAAKKTDASLISADLYRVVGDSENAIAGYKSILETSPDHLDALAGAGLSLVNLGYMNNDKSKFQEGANFLQKFASLAPDTHKFKADAVALIDMLKKEQNVTPQKITTTRKRPN